jgi:hypothetical protein
MKLHLKSVLLAASAALSIATPLTASARSQAANAAGFRPTCLTESFGAVVNSCTATQTFSYNGAIDTTNIMYHVNVRAQGPSAQSNVTCWAHGVSEDGASFWLSNTQSLPFFGPSADLAALNVFVPTDGYLNIYCRLLPGGSVIGFRY